MRCQDATEGLKQPRYCYRGRNQLTAGLGVCRRFVKVITDYCMNVLQQVQSCSDEDVPKPDELIEIRRDTIGVRPLFVFVEYANGLDLPDDVFAHPLVKEIETLGVDWILIQNEILSYRQEEVCKLVHGFEDDECLPFHCRKKASITTSFRPAESMAWEHKRHLITWEPNSIRSVHALRPQMLSFHLGESVSIRRS